MTNIHSTTKQFKYLPSRPVVFKPDFKITGAPLLQNLHLRVQWLKFGWEVQSLSVISLSDPFLELIISSKLPPRRL